MLKLLLFAVAAYLLFLALVFVTQHRLLYFPDTPGRAVTTSPRDIGLDYEDVRLRTEDGVTLHGWFVPAAKDAQGALLFFHGNAGNISHRLDSIRQFHELGLHVLIVDYRGYGESEGKPSETGTYRDAEAAWRYLTEELGHPPGRITIFGRSLGGAVAAWLASEREPGALIVESSFSSATRLAKDLYPFLPVRWLSRFRYDTASAVAHTDCPVLVIHSRDDEIIPFRHGLAIREAAGERGDLLELGGPHNGAHLLDEERYVAALRGFLARVSAPPRETIR